MKFIKLVKNNLNLILIFLLLFFSSFATAMYSSEMLNDINLYIDWNKNNYYQSYEKKQKEIALVYLGSSNCLFCKQLEQLELDKAKSWLSRESNSKNMNFTSIGISIDWKLHDGLKHLLEVAKFDEVITGNNWYNHGVLKYIGEFQQETFTPQIFITVREYDSNDLDRKLLSEEPILILKGRKEISDWIIKPFINIK